ncbi:hypothetical protein HHK36_008064 [Tetracentron sinense]|uniref:FLZ-type domain-containing protein n=1 Tax=Tetracentron sinense TaxID=13715 RepID=A0A834ZE09_TETSI|nr:hypothetical protein HHK36_008064 [Tetracentron sinense]
MLLGKRPRPQMKRTTSMTEFTVDLSNVEALPPSDPQNPIKDFQKAVGVEGPARRNTGVGGPNGFDPRFLTTISTRNHKRNSGDFTESTHFLRACGLCKRRLAPGRDIYMYRGDTAYCSLECRQQQMNRDERKEKCSLASKKESAAATAGSEGPTKGETVAAA